MFNFILSRPLTDGRFVLPNTELATIEPSKLKDIEMKIITPLSSQGIEYLKERFDSKYRMPMERWSEMIPSEDTPSEIAQTIRSLSEFAKERIERHEHKLITKAMFVNDPASQVLFSQFFGEASVTCLYKDGYFDPFSFVGIYTADILTKAIKKSIKNPSDQSDQFRAIREAMTILIVKNCSTEWCSAS